MTQFIGYNVQSVVGARMAAINGEGLDGVCADRLAGLPTDPRWPLLMRTLRAQP